MQSEQHEPQYYALRVLRMVHELHRMGYQRLRIMPGMSSSGCYWRCLITPISNILKEHGAWARDWHYEQQNDAGVFYTSGMMGRYFNWVDAEKDSPKRLALKFVKRFPRLAAAGRGADWAYAGWYMQMLAWPAKGAFPIAYFDGMPHQLEELLTTGGKPLGRLPMPPGGECDDKLPWPVSQQNPSDLPMGLGPLLEAKKAGKRYLGDPEVVLDLVKKFQRVALADMGFKCQEEQDALCMIFLGHCEDEYLPMAGNWNRPNGGLAKTVGREVGLEEADDGHKALRLYFSLLGVKTRRLSQDPARIAQITRQAVHTLLGVPEDTWLPTDDRAA